MNIFARELALILGGHAKELSSLFGLRIQDPYGGGERQITPTKVTRLKRSLSEDITATLNADELDALQAWVPLDEDGEELRRLRAALVAEAVRYLLTGRMARDQADELGEIVLALLLGQDSRQMGALRARLLESVRGAADSTGVTGESLPEALSSQDPSEHALDPAIEVYEQGSLWLEIARDTADRGARLGYAALAMRLLTRARDLVTNAPTVAQGTPQQSEWLAAIEATLTDAKVIH